MFGDVHGVRKHPVMTDAVQCGEMENVYLLVSYWYGYISEFNQGTSLPVILLSGMNGKL